MNAPLLPDADVPDTAKRPTVILVHGLWTGRWAMLWLARRLEAAGMHAIRFGYPSVGNSLDANATALAAFAGNLGAEELHWVGHSLGGMLIFRTLQRGGLPPGRVVMLGSPLRGSHAAARLAGFGLGRHMLGLSVRDWFAAPESEWRLPHALGIIAGTAGIGLGRLVAPGLPRPNDGAVTVAETRLPGVEHISLPVSHSGMLFSVAVADCATAFLREGRFPP